MCCTKLDYHVQIKIHFVSPSNFLVPAEKLRLHSIMRCTHLLSATRDLHLSQFKVTVVAVVYFALSTLLYLQCLLKVLGTPIQC